MLQLNQQISGFENAKLNSIDGKKYNTKEDDLLCIKSINKDNTINLASIDSFYVEGKFIGKEYKNIPIKQVLEVLLDIELKDEDFSKTSIIVLLI